MVWLASKSVLSVFALVPKGCLRVWTATIVAVLCAISFKLEFLFLSWKYNDDVCFG